MEKREKLQGSQLGRQKVPEKNENTIWRSFLRAFWWKGSRALVPAKNKGYEFFKLKNYPENDGKWRKSEKSTWKVHNSGSKPFQKESLGPFERKYCVLADRKQGYLDFWAKTRVMRIWSWQVFVEHFSQSKNLHETTFLRSYAKKPNPKFLKFHARSI